MLIFAAVTLFQLIQGYLLSLLYSLGAARLGRIA
jgi:hypothetical protein